MAELHSGPEAFLGSPPGECDFHAGVAAATLATDTRREVQDMAAAATDLLHPTPKWHRAPPLLLRGGCTVSDDEANYGKQATDYLLRERIQPMHYFDVCTRVGTHSGTFVRKLIRLPIGQPGQSRVPFRKCFRKTQVCFDLANRHSP
jgi:hypothetical protein